MTTQLPQVQTGPYPKSFPDYLLVLSSALGRISMSPEAISLTADGPLGQSIIEVQLNEEEFGRKFVTDVSTESVRETVTFLEEQMSNYEDEFPEDFKKGFLAAIEIFKGEKFLEDYLG